mmetsp:Transcript_42558/g.66670  ORF Transcript_42558/g.66670 Transcript_42558/m.66670 type:complete len:334 (-) Transcript_42558:479-1480(-)
MARVLKILILAASLQLTFVPLSVSAKSKWWYSTREVTRRIEAGEIKRPCYWEQIADRQFWRPSSEQIINASYVAIATSGSGEVKKFSSLRKFMRWRLEQDQRTEQDATARWSVYFRGQKFQQADTWSGLGCEGETGYISPVPSGANISSSHIFGCPEYMQSRRFAPVEDFFKEDWTPKPEICAEELELGYRPEDFGEQHLASMKENITLDEIQQDYGWERANLSDPVFARRLQKAREEPLPHEAALIESLRRLKGGSGTKFTASQLSMRSAGLRLRGGMRLITHNVMASPIQDVEVKSPLGIVAENITICCQQMDSEFICSMIQRLDWPVIPG